MTIINKPTPHFTKGREGNKISKIIMHWIGQGTPQGAIDWFNNPKSKVSAHYLIDGTNIYQFVKDEDTAWHAGDWGVNLESIGIEHYATKEHPANEETYLTSIELVKGLCSKYNIPIDDKHILKHSNIVSTSCPGTLDVARIIAESKVVVNVCEEIEKDRDYQKSEKERYKKERNDLRIKLDKKESELAESKLKNERLLSQNYTVSEALNFVFKALRFEKR